MRASIVVPDDAPVTLELTRAEAETLHAMARFIYIYTHRPPFESVAFDLQQALEAVGVRSDDVTGSDVIERQLKPFGFKA